MNNTNTKTPVHLWIIGILALLWNAGGAYDYIATKFRIESYMSQFSPEMLEYFYAFPAWMSAAWAIAVWGALLGAILLLLRKSLAVWFFGVAILGLAVSSVYNFVLTDGSSLMGDNAVVLTLIIWVIALLLFFYARAMAKRGVLR